MKKYIFLLLLFCAIENPLSAQNNRTYAKPDDNYVLNGSINMDTGKISLISIGQDYYPVETDFKEAIIDHGRFTFTGTAPYPFAAMLLSRGGEGYVTNMFYIEKGIQTITCNKDSAREIPDIDNNSMKELKGSYADAFTAYNYNYYTVSKSWDSLQSAYGKNIPDSDRIKWRAQNRELGYEASQTLLAYTKEHRDSYVALWKLVKSLGFGYNPIYDTIYNTFSRKIRNTYTGQALKAKLHAATNTTIGVAFPQLYLLDTNYSAHQLKLIHGIHKYTLIDFWFSHCSACLGQFPGYKKIYKTYKRGQLEIIAISIDSKANTGAWKKVIHDKELPWQQYLDEGGKLAAVMNINYYPSNFLLDENNIIIRKNISPEELEQILSK